MSGLATPRIVSSPSASALPSSPSRMSIERNVIVSVSSALKHSG
ncbi:MAG: hypothetical protein ACLP01_27200 [Solirubrobacteraceae bacterium]